MDRHYLIEAQKIHEDKLKEFTMKYKNSDYILSVAGDGEGELFFDDGDLFGGLASHEKKYDNLVTVPMVRVDKCVSSLYLKGPFLIKLDTHGFEVPIFEGSENTLRETNLIVVEVYNFQIADKSLLFFEMCDYLYKKGFRSIGIVDILYRPKDGFLWQFDLIFARSSRKEFLDVSY
jgi:FkbM family methyltransferase